MNGGECKETAEKSGIVYKSLQHTLTHMSLSWSNLISAQYTALLVSSLICEYARSITRIFMVILMTVYDVLERTCHCKYNKKNILSHRQTKLIMENVKTLKTYKISNRFYRIISLEKWGRTYFFEMVKVTNLKFYVWNILHI